MSTSSIITEKVGTPLYHKIWMLSCGAHLSCLSQEMVETSNKYIFSFISLPAIFLDTISLSFFQFLSRSDLWPLRAIVSFRAGVPRGYRTSTWI